jgi:hypothetical protein
MVSHLEGLRPFHPDIIPLLKQQMENAFDELDTEIRMTSYQDILKNTSTQTTLYYMLRDILET